MTMEQMVGNVTDRFDNTSPMKYQQNLIEYTSTLESRVARENQELVEIFRRGDTATQDAEDLLEQVRAIGRQLDSYLSEMDFFPVYPDEKIS